MIGWCKVVESFDTKHQCFFGRLTQLLPPVQSSRKQYRRRDRIVVSTLRCGRNNPGSNPGHGSVKQFSSAKKKIKWNYSNTRIQGYKSTRILVTLWRESMETYIRRSLNTIFHLSCFSSVRCISPLVFLAQGLTEKKILRWHNISTVHQSVQENYAYFQGESMETLNKAKQYLAFVLLLHFSAFVAQGLEHWSCKPGVESSNLSEGFFWWVSMGHFWWSWSSALPFQYHWECSSKR